MEMVGVKRVSNFYDAFWKPIIKRMNDEAWEELIKGAGLGQQPRNHMDAYFVNNHKCNLYITTEILEDKENTKREH